MNKQTVTERIEKSQKTASTLPSEAVPGNQAVLHTDRGNLLIANCTSGFPLAAKTVKRYETDLVASGSSGEFRFLQNVDTRFPDGESCAELTEYVSGHDVFLFQSLYHPENDACVDKNYLAFLIAVRTFKEHGARHITGVLPYLAYARQDKPTRFRREPTTARLMADFSVAAGLDRLVTWHPHCEQLKGFYGTTRADMLEPFSLFVNEFRKSEGDSKVIAVAPDAGASRLVTYFSRALDITSAVASKYREGQNVEISEVIGNFKGKKKVIILDDILSSGNTVFELIRKINEKYSIDEITIAVSHNLCTPEALEKLTELHRSGNLKEVVVTNSIPQTASFTSLPFFRVKCLSDYLFTAIQRIHRNESLSDVFLKDIINTAAHDNHGSR